MSFVATPTKSTRETVARTLQLIQKTNSWTQGTDLEQDKDSQGKTRSRFCLRGAIRAAVAGSTEAAEVTPKTTRAHRLAKSAGKAITKTVNANPEQYGLDEEDSVDSIVGFNDNSQVEHKHVIRALRDTLVRLEPAPSDDVVGCGG